MSVEYFSSNAITKLSEIPERAHVHIIGVCGVAMAQIACVLAARGYRVSGSDKEFYDPMGSLLRRSAVKLYQGYLASHVPDQCDLVVIGNAVTRDNPEVVQTLARGLRYTMFPPLLYDICIETRHSLVVAGTHGKTTTTACGAFLLEKMGLKPSYFIGGEVLDLKESLVCGQGAWSIVEGDEYDSSFFAKVPKFFFYGAHTAILTSIEFDHADIYQSLEDVERAFDGLIERLGHTGTLVACSDDAGVIRLLERWKGKGPRVITYGSSEDADMRIETVHVHSDHQEFTLRLRQDGVVAGVAATSRIHANTKLTGLHNLRNITGVLAAFSAVGLNVASAVQYLPEFRGVRRRQEVRFDAELTLIEDFAHHPSAVRETIAAIRSRYPGRRLWAVFEPRSNTSRRRVFQKDYERAFYGADRVLLSGVTMREKDISSDLLSVEELAEGVRRQGIACEALASPVEVRATLQQQTCEGDVILLMSNGSFGNLPALFTQDLHTKYRSRA